LTGDGGVRLAWEEALARVMVGFRVQNDISPAWLVNPETKRRLKLNKFYPEIDFAVRFVGLQARGQRRRSDEEVLAEKERERIRQALCRQHGVTLLSLQLYDPDRARTVDRLLLSLAEVSRRVRRRSWPQAEKVALLSRLADARDRASALRRQMSSEKGMEALVAAWRDRQLNAIRAAQQAPSANRAEMKHVPYKLGMKVVHQHFGRGIVTGLNSTDHGKEVVVHFAPEIGDRVFLLSFVGDKLRPAL